MITVSAPGRALCLAFILLAAGCGFQDRFRGGGDAGAGPDAGPDAGSDGGSDLGTDVGTDAGSDAGDAGTDSGVCMLAESICADANTLRRCNGLLTEEIPCAMGCTELAAGGAHCNACVPNTLQSCVAAGTELQGCDAEGTISIMPCVEGCIPGAFQCNACVPSTVMCVSGQLVTCDVSGMQSADNCMGFGCGASGVEVCNECVPSTMSCSANDLIDCDAMGLATVVDTCVLGCTEPAAGLAHCNECTPSAPFCGMDGNAHGCSVEGLDTGVSELCHFGCSAGACDPAPFMPSNVPALTLDAALASPTLGGFDAARWSPALVGDWLVVNTNSGEMVLYRGTTVVDTLRGAGAGEVDGVYFETVAQGGGARPELGIFIMTAFDLPAGLGVRVIGGRSFVLVTTGCLFVSGAFVAGAGVYSIAEGALADLPVDDGVIAGAVGTQGPGGFPGGDSVSAGAGPGAGLPGIDGVGTWSGGGGAGYGGGGGDGGDETDGTTAAGGAGGPPYYCGGPGGTMTCGSMINETLVPLVGGSGGAGGGHDSSSGAGGSGGGAVQFSSLDPACGFVLSTGALIDVGGEGGRGGGADNRSGGGGGAGGAVLMEGITVLVDGVITSNGGAGGGGDDGAGSATHGLRGRTDTLPSLGGLPAGSGGTGGTGGAGGSPDGSNGVDDNDAPGGGGGATGRIRINATTIITGASIMSPDSGTAPNSSGPLP